MTVTPLVFSFKADEHQVLPVADSLGQAVERVARSRSVQVLAVASRELDLLPRGVVRLLVTKTSNPEVLGTCLRLVEEVLRRTEIWDVLVDGGTEPAGRSAHDAYERLAGKVGDIMLDGRHIGLSDAPGHIRPSVRRRHKSPSRATAVRAVARHHFTPERRTQGMDQSILDTIGSPLVEVDAPEGTTIAAKIEPKNPGGSAKDRPALYMVEAAEEAGDLAPGDTIVEPTSGNTGIGIAVVAAAKGYDVRIVMPASKSAERRRIMRAYGAEIELVEGDISAAKDRADEIEREDGAVQLRQFENPANPRAHYETTGPEILDQVGDRTVDALVAGVGTGGTISGTGNRLLEEFPDVEIVAVEPEGNAPITTGEGGTDDFQGMGPGFISDNLDTDIITTTELVALDDAETECRRLAREEGILVGQSSAASLLAAKRVARDLKGERDDPLIVTIFWDSGERYMSTGLFD